MRESNILPTFTNHYVAVVQDIISKIISIDNMSWGCIYVILLELLFTTEPLVSVDRKGQTLLGLMTFVACNVYIILLNYIRHSYCSSFYYNNFIGYRNISRRVFIGCWCYRSTQNLYHKQLPPLDSGHAIINLLSICIKCWNSNIYRRFPGACAGRPLTLRPRARSPRMRLLSVRCAWVPRSGHDEQLQVLNTAMWIWCDETNIEP